MRAARLAGSRSARNCAASCAVGRVPMTSRKARRRNTASEARQAGWISRRLRRSKTRASMGDWAGRGAALSKVGLRARSAPAATPAALTARNIANRDKRIWIAELVYRSNPLVGEKFWFCRREVFGNGIGFVWYARGPSGCVVGTRLKIYEAMAAQIPVVSTTIGAEGLSVNPPQDIRIADSPEHFASHCLELLASPEIRAGLSRAAWEMVNSHF